MVQCRSFSWRSKKGVLFYFEENVKIAAGAAIGAGLAFVGEAKPVAIGNTGGDGDFQFAIHLDDALAAAIVAGIANDLAGTAALVASSANREEALLIEHLAFALALRTGGDAAAGFRTLAIAASALFMAGNLNFSGHAEDGVFELDLRS